MIVDCHMHSWTYPEHFRRDLMLKNLPERRRHESEEWYKKIWDAPLELYWQGADEAGVGKAILNALRDPYCMAVVTPNDWLAEQVKRYPDKMAWACGVNMIDPLAADEVERCVKELGAIAIGELIPPFEYYYVNDSRCFPVYEKAIELDIPIIYHCIGTGFSLPRGMLKYGDPVYLDEVAIKYPELKVIVCHMGMEHYKTCVQLMNKHKNIYADISDMAHVADLDRAYVPKYLPFVHFPYFSYLEPLLYYFSRTGAIGGTDKLIWGSDWAGGSVEEVKQELDAVSKVNPELRKLGLPEIPEQCLQNILHENWKKLFKF